MNEVGLALLPVAGRADPSDAGIAIAPYTEGHHRADVSAAREHRARAHGRHRRRRRRRVQLSSERREPRRRPRRGCAFSGTGFGMVLRYAPKARSRPRRPSARHAPPDRRRGGRTHLRRDDGNRVEVGGAASRRRGCRWSLRASDPDAFVGRRPRRQGNRDPDPVQSSGGRAGPASALQGLRIAATVSPNLSIGPIRVETCRSRSTANSRRAAAARAVLEVGAGLSAAVSVRSRSRSRASACR